MSDRRERVERLVLDARLWAVLRALTILPSRKKLTMDGVVKMLSEAQKDTSALGGFENISQRDKSELVSFMLRHNLIVTDSENHISLTLLGKMKGMLQLNPEVESYLMTIYK